MRAMRLIMQRELAHYFASPLAYLIAGAFLLLTGVTFYSDLNFSISIRPVAPALIPDLLAQMMILFAPLLTMRLLSEENREGTMELLMTAPVSDGNIVFGKFLSAWAYYTFLLLLTLIYQFILVNVAIPDISHTIAAYLGIWLYGGATLAIGLLFSATTENQILAAFMATIALLLLYYGDSLGQVVASVDLAYILFNLTLQGHYAASFAIGAVRAEDIVYYAGLIVVALFIAIRIVESKRWR